ncbi:MAG: hydrogenase maturation protease [Candidatus Aenigmarchaeota archaeon]|nr:hydrogenase maturation protease [Candidatus Aenigmarchaeota archaeon]
MRKVVIGMGNPLKRDDNIGNLVIDELKKKIKDKDILFIRAETNPENFVGKIKLFNPDIIYFIDAVDFDGEVGEVKVFSIDAVLNESLSTHGISVKVFEDFFPDVEIYVVGVKPDHVDYGEGLSLTLRENFDNIVKGIKKIIYSMSI